MFDDPLHRFFQSLLHWGQCDPSCEPRVHHSRPDSAAQTRRRNCCDTTNKWWVRHIQ